MDTDEDFFYSDEDDFLEEDFSDDDFDTFEPEDEILLQRQKSYVNLSEKELKEEASVLISEVEEVLNVNYSIAAALLHHFNWNREKLIERYSENPKKTARAAGLSSTKKPLYKGKSRRKLTCPVCMEEVTSSQSAALPCKHFYCKSCWETYLVMKIKGGPECVNTRCMFPSCKELVTKAVIDDLAPPETRNLYTKYLFRSYNADNPLIKWCPAPGCTYAVRCERRDRREAVSCECGFNFCFVCCDFEIGDHIPATCDQIEKWLQKASDESENVKWLLANTKKCPNCRAPIEKNGGCMHITCKKNSGGCGHEFCWLCRGPWSEHGSLTGGFYACNKYDKSQAKKEDKKAEDAKTILETYMFYFHRYESHRNARKVADKQRRQAQRKGLDLQGSFDVRSADTKFLMEATEQLLRNRKVLEFSYVYGYYLRDSDVSEQERNLFEYLQEELEKHTDHLSEIYEETKVKDYQAFIAWKEDVTNYTRITQKFLDNFVTGVTSGLTV